MTTLAIYEIIQPFCVNWDSIDCICGTIWVDLNFVFNHCVRVAYEFEGRRNLTRFRESECTYSKMYIVLIDL